MAWNPAVLMLMVIDPLNPACTWMLPRVRPVPGMSSGPAMTSRSKLTLLASEAPVGAAVMASAVSSTPSWLARLKVSPVLDSVPCTFSPMMSSSLAFSDTDR